MDTLSLKPLIDLFEQSMSELELLLRSANIFEQIGDRESNPSPDDILVKTAKGISFVFLFSAYEQLLKGTVRAVLETANSYRGKLKNMQDGFIAAALNSSFRSYADASNVKTKIGNARDVRSLLDSYVRDLKFTDYFPDDGSYMKSTQVRTICYLFDLGDPAPILGRAWSHIDDFQYKRNEIAHGSVLPSKIGENYSALEIESFYSEWRCSWVAFAEHIEKESLNPRFWTRR